MMIWTKRCKNYLHREVLIKKNNNNKIKTKTKRKNILGPPLCPYYYYLLPCSFLFLFFSFLFFSFLFFSFLFFSFLFFSFLFFSFFFCFVIFFFCSFFRFVHYVSKRNDHSRIIHLLGSFLFFSLFFFLEKLHSFLFFIEGLHVGVCLSTTPPPSLK